MGNESRDLLLSITDFIKKSTGRYNDKEVCKTSRLISILNCSQLCDTDVVVFIHVVQSLSEGVFIVFVMNEHYTI